MRWTWLVLALMVGTARAEPDPDDNQLRPKVGVAMLGGVARIGSRTDGGIGVGVALGLERGAFGGDVEYANIGVPRDGQSSGPSDHAFALHGHLRLATSVVNTLWLTAGIAEHVVVHDGPARSHSGADVGIAARIEPYLGEHRLKLAGVCGFRAFVTAPDVADAVAARSTSPAPPERRVDFGVLFQFGWVFGY